MSQLFFGNLPSVLTSLLFVGLLAYVLFVAIWNRQITKWGGKVFFLTLLGLAVGLLAAYRDDYFLSLQYASGVSAFHGRFPVDGLVSQLSSIGGVLIGGIALSCLFIRRQGYRKAVFFLAAFLILAKTVFVEYARFLTL
ncbi:MAG: hypothetical protein ACOX6U_09315 [Oscillospiraceae bacterium]